MTSTDRPDAASFLTRSISGPAVSYSLSNEIELEGYEKVLINVGSVGQPRDENPKAACAIYDTDESGRLERVERLHARADRLERIAARHQAAVDEYDTDGDDRLSTDERAPLREALRARVRGEHLGEDLGEDSSRSTAY